MEETLTDEQHENRDRVAARARSLAAFYAAGGLLNVASCLTPGWHPASRAGLLGIAAIALLTAVGLLALGTRAHDALCHLLLTFGSGLIGLCMLSAGASPMALCYAFFFTWVAVYAANWFTGRALACHLLIAAASEAGAVAEVGLNGIIVPACLVSMGACVAAGLVVHRLRAQVQNLAMRDPLTGALNRRGLTRMLASTSHRSGPALTVIALDLDGFKAYNDTHGHARGDQALRHCVKNWTALLGRGESCARLGGDEFVLLCYRPAAAIPALTAKVRGCAQPLLRVSVGVAAAAAGESTADLFARADAALYIDKHVPKARGESAAVTESQHGRAIALRSQGQPA